jgi:hypothetical protein
MSPRYIGSAWPPFSSTSRERGLANWPAIARGGHRHAARRRQPLRHRRQQACSARMFSGENSAKLSAQSPPAGKKPRPPALRQVRRQRVPPLAGHQRRVGGKLAQACASGRRQG